jgi:hypothetical protein|nr:putative DNA binding protein [uncultured Mediterranean phage uvMED]BAR30665.1 putative DNA binding protein [uncultured Mediterranean phage uvMED]|tara:strand:- start:4106 stop:4432 length:327 start_codon:yes stop_codon:yes gene_type:complete
MGHKSTNAEIEQRVKAVYGLLVKSYSRFQILQYASDQWDVSDRTADIYIQRARQLIQQDSEIERPQWLAAAIARLVEYEKRAGSDDRQLLTAIKALETQAKLLRFDMS